MAAARQPVHVVYGGAHLFRADVARRLGDRALAALDEHLPDADAFAETFDLPPSLAATVCARVRDKLVAEPVEDFRVDFEDGFGARSGAEERAEAARVGEELARGVAAGSLPPFVGIRIKPLGGATTDRALGTLATVLDGVVRGTGGRLPDGFAVTLPKVEDPAEVRLLARALDDAEARLGLAAGAVAVELMVETPRALLDADGRAALPALVAAAEGRCRGAHFGPYDYTRSLGIAGVAQELRHPACDVARALMQLALAGTGVQLADGPTTRVPVGDAARDAMRAHFDDARHSLRLGFWQGWDVHPAQLVPRWTAVHSFFLEALPAATARLRAFLDAARRATRAGDAFDDAATAEGLADFFRRGAACGAITPDEVRAAGLVPDAR